MKILALFIIWTLRILLFLVVLLNPFTWFLIMTGITLYLISKYRKLVETFEGV